MALKKYKPQTAGRRHASVLITEAKVRPSPKRLLQSQRRGSGRNNQGKITVRHKGGGAKQHYRIVDFLQEKMDVSGRVIQIEYDPNRSARIALVQYRDGDLRYVLAPVGLTKGSSVITSRKQVAIAPGNRTALEFIPSGQPICNIELFPGRGGTVVRSAGSAATLMALDGAKASVRMPSSETRIFSKDCLATIGQVSNEDWRTVRLGKAGRMRNYGVRPTVRGKVMNPVDHPHGGGEGKHPIGMKHPKTPWGKPALGVRTRKAAKRSNRWIAKRRRSRQQWGTLR